MFKMTKKKALIGLVIVGVVAGWFGFHYLPTVPVRVASVKKDVISKIIPEDGLVRTREEVNVNAEVSGKIDKLLVEESKEVQAGDIVAEIEKTYADAQVKQAEAELSANDKLVKELKSVYNKAKDDYARMKSLAKDGAISPQALEEAQVTFESAKNKYEAAQATAEGLKAALDSVKDRLAKTTIRSPIAGIVTLVQHKAGEAVVPGTPLMRIINPKTAYVEIQITDSDMSEIKVGQPVRITADGCPGQEFQGTLSKIVPEAELKGERIDVSTVGKERIFRGVVAMPEYPACLRPGMSLYADVLVETKDNALVIPRNTVLIDSGNFYVYVVKDGRAERKYIQVGIKESGKVEITRGVAEGETIAIDGLEKLSDGKRVNVIK